MNRLFAGLTIVVGCAAVVPAQAPATRAVVDLLPPTTVLYAELTDPAALLSIVVDHPLRAKIEALPPYQQAIQTPQYKQMLQGRDRFETVVGMPWRQAIETFTANGVTLAVDGASRGVAVIVQGKDAATMKTFRDKFVAFASMGNNANKLQSVDYRGIAAHRLDEARFALFENQLLITNNSDLGKAILDRMIDGNGESLKQNERFQSAQRTRSSDATAWAFVDVQTIRNAGVADAVYNDQINNPVLELLLGGIQSGLKETPFATANLTASTEQLALQLAMPYDIAWVPEQREYFFGPDGLGRGPAIASVNPTLFTLSTHRDFAQMWLRAGDLFNEQINDGFAKADATLTTLFAGADFGEDILGSVEPEVGFVATRQDFADRLPRPTIKLPAFGIVMTMKEPETMTRDLRRTFQSMIGFFNVVGAMNGQNQLEMDMEKLSDDAQLVTSNYVPEDDDRESTDAPILFNFSPTVGFSGDRFVVASTTDLARQLTLAKPPSPAQIDDNTAANLRADTLQQILDDNREQLIAQNMLEDGNSREEAQAAIDLLLQVVGYFRDASIRLSQPSDQLELEFNVRIGE
ncbi:MAG: hypothetical protein HKN47_22535 [Pirellulaceae bacterium]|nr:hypothetical protein [Pirellulaceae bacterium]